MQRIEHHSAHGVYTATPAQLDDAIARHLPASANDLRALLVDADPDIDWSDLTDVSALLIVLAYYGI